MTESSLQLDNAPIALFVYNRVGHMRRTVSALQQNFLAGVSDLYIYSDAPKSEDDFLAVSEVRKYAADITGFKSVTLVLRQNNFGLARSIIDGVTQLTARFGHVIVLEDDMVTSPFFLCYMNDGLRLYASDPKVASIHGYVYPLTDADSLPPYFFLKGADCWGWATWSRAWRAFDADGQSLLSRLESRQLTREFDFSGGYEFTQMLRDQVSGKNNSWAVRWYASAFLEGMLTLYPSRSFVHNIGNDSSGTHSSASNLFDAQLSFSYDGIHVDSVTESDEARKSFVNYLRSIRPTYLERIVRFFRRLVSV